MTGIMPFIAFFIYMVAEAVAFWAVSSWIGVGWALVALFATMFFGMSIAALEVRRIMSSQVHRKPDGTLVAQPANPGRTAGNVGLTLAGGVLLTLPGFITTAMGILLIFPPTRAFIRTLVTVKLLRTVERLGVRVYEASPMAEHHTSYGTFNSSADDLVIDEDEIRRWSENADPDDFGKGGPRA